MEIKYNTEFSRWEVYGSDAQIRSGEKQPDYVSESFDKCLTYKLTVEGARK